MESKCDCASQFQKGYEQGRSEARERIRHLEHELGNAQMKGELANYFKGLAESYRKIIEENGSRDRIHLFQRDS